MLPLSPRSWGGWSGPWPLAMHWLLRDAHNLHKMREELEPGSWKGPPSSDPEVLGC